MTIHPGPRAYNAAEPPDPRRELIKRLVFFELLDAGQWIAARGMLALSLPITDELCDELAGALAAIVERHRGLLC
jgi:glutamate-1-semialdehyde 2,1-aminomutase